MLFKYSLLVLIFAFCTSTTKGQIDTINIDSSNKIRKEYIYYLNGLPRSVQIFRRDTIIFQMGWYANGFPNYIYNYCDGTICGVSKHFYETGQLKYTAEYKNGVLNGKRIWYSQNQRRQSIQYYKNGQEIKKTP